MVSVNFLHHNPLSELVWYWEKRKYKDRDDIVQAKDDPTLEEDHLKAAYIRSIPKAQIFKGVLLQGYFMSRSILYGLEDFEIKPDDIFIITYPKSGTTWTEEIVSLISNGGDENKINNKLLVDRVNHLEVGRPIEHLRYLRNLKSPRLLATHLTVPLIPKQLREAKCKIIYVVRNPKDNAVSYFFHHKMSKFLGNSNLTWEEYLTLYMKGQVVYGSWFDHVLPYWQLCKEYPDKVLFISFEELKLNLSGMVSRIANFLNYQLTPEAINAIASHCTFDKMKTNNMVNREVLPVTDIFDMKNHKFMRKGIIGDWKNHFSSSQNEVFDKIFKERMKESDLEIVFEDEEAFKKMDKYGRLIHNHPQPTYRYTLRNSLNENTSEKQTSSFRYKSVKNTSQCTRCKNTSVPTMQMYLSPDPLALDSIQ